MTPTVVLSPAQLAATEVVLEGEAYRHLYRARRLRADETVRVVDGAGHARWARARQVGRHAAQLVLGGDAPANEPASAFHLLAAWPRPERAAWLVEKATEVGVTAIRFVRWERSVRAPGEGQLARLRRVAVAAVEQCQRARVPELSGGHALHELPTLLAGVATAWVLDPGAAAALAAAPGPWALAVGPEGGWTAQERAALVGRGFSPVTLGARVLRVETAAVVGAARVLLPGEPG